MSKYYGLHWTDDDGTPIQIILDLQKVRAWARSAPNGEWTAWRRLDVTRNADGTLAEEVAEATHAKHADKATSLYNPIRLTFNGDVSGSVKFNGSGDTTITLSVPGLSSLSSRVSALEGRTSSYGYSSSYNDYD